MVLQVTIWLGVFPIVVSWWAALGLTVYFIATWGRGFGAKSFVRIDASRHDHQLGTSDGCFDD